ncbi:apolipophorins-like [Haliotis cracherodii]|uniref:apolipophorins-like n=1 Tax=Haliotis cracherodii TaxID=6455 RepID=UPI0039EB872C
MEGATSNRASLGFRAIAEIEVLSKCEMALRLRDVKVYRSDPSTDPMENADETGEFKRNLERSPLRFSFQDGVVEELCPAEGETTWALNIKRGLLTAVQNSMDSLDRDQSVFEYRVPSEIQSLPFMKSTHECEQELDKNGLLKSALIRETHTFRPFSRATSGATTKVLQKLNYKTRISGVTTRQDDCSSSFSSAEETSLLHTTSTPGE